MHVRCLLREIRGDRPLSKIAEQSGLNRGALSDLERGLRLAPERWVEALEEAYGAPRQEWYPPHVLYAITPEDPA